MSKKLTTEEFIDKAKKIHNNKYDYSKVNYINNRTKVCIICPEHGEFWQNPSSHLRGHGCDECGGTFTSNKEKFIKKAKEIHGDKYDYSKVNYINNKTKVCIICPKHGEFWQRPDRHLIDQGCPECNGSYKLTTKEFIKKAKEIHGDKYDYSKVKYNGNKVKVCIICPEHGEFWQIPISHLKGYNCPICSNRKKYTLSEFIKIANKIHNNKYNYCNFIYVNNKTKGKIICKNCNTIFIQTPHDHLQGKGCPHCNQSHLEREMELFLNDNNIKFEYQKHFEWLSLMSLDFYLSDYNIGIECQGIQHFKPIDYFGGLNKYKQLIDRDNLKKCLCEENNIKILYFSNLGIDYPYQVFENKSKLLEEINKK